MIMVKTMGPLLVIVFILCGFCQSYSLHSDRIAGERKVDDVPVVLKGQLSTEDAFDLLMARLREKTADRVQKARMIVTTEMSEKDIQEICGTSASLECGKSVFSSLQDVASIHQRCNVRNDFLQCIDEERMRCQMLALSGEFPLLPPPSQIRQTQSKIWRALWTSGGCVLAN